MRIRISLAILLVASILSACATPPPTATHTVMPSATPNPSPSSTPEPPTSTPTAAPTETMSPTATAIIATRTATPQPTETPESSTEYQILSDGSTAFLRKDGKWQEIPAIEGLKPSIEEVAGFKTVVYRAEAGNKWGFEVGERVGVVDPNQYELNLDEQMEQVGGVGLHPEIAKTLLWASGFPNEIKICSPVDTTTAWNPANKNVALVIQTSKNIAENASVLYDVFLKAPQGSTFIVPVSNVSVEKPLTFRPANQSTGWSTLAVGENGIFGDLAIKAFFHRSISGNFQGLNLGGKLAIFGTEEFPSDVVAVYTKYRDPPPPFGFNANLILQSYFSRAFGNLTTQNIVRLGNSFVSALSQGSPVLQN